jgi:hypothetical protein
MSAVYLGEWDILVPWQISISTEHRQVYKKFKDRLNLFSSSK